MLTPFAEFVWMESQGDLSTVEVEIIEQAFSELVFVPAFLKALDQFVEFCTGILEVSGLDRDVLVTSVKF